MQYRVKVDLSGFKRSLRSYKLGEFKRDFIEVEADDPDMACQKVYERFIWVLAPQMDGKTFENFQEESMNKLFKIKEVLDEARL